MKKIIYKALNGKLLRIQFNADGGVIKNIKIAGDFFVHPEKAILDIEQFLVGKKIHKIEKELSNFLIKKNIQIIGFTAKDLQEAMTKL